MKKEHKNPRRAIGAARRGGLSRTSTFKISQFYHKTVGNARGARP